MLSKLTDIFMDFVDIEPSDVSAESYFSQDLGFNSYDFLSMLSEVEDEFEVKFSESAPSELFTVQNLMDYIEAQK